MYQLALFVVIGGAGFLVNLGTTYLLTEYAGLWYLGSFVAGTLLSWTFVFLANSLITFEGHSKDRYARRYFTFIAGYGTIFAINAALVYALTSLFGIYYLLSILLVTGGSTLATFFLSKKYIYRDVPSADAPHDVGGA